MMLGFNLFINLHRRIPSRSESSKFPWNFSPTMVSIHTWASCSCSKSRLLAVCKKTQNRNKIKIICFSNVVCHLRCHQRKQIEKIKILKRHFNESQKISNSNVWKLLLQRAKAGRQEWYSDPIFIQLYINWQKIKPHRKYNIFHAVFPF